MKSERRLTRNRVFIGKKISDRLRCKADTELPFEDRAVGPANKQVDVLIFQRHKAWTGECVEYPFQWQAKPAIADVHAICRVVDPLRADIIILTETRMPCPRLD